MDELQDLSHTMWDCRYRLVWIPKHRKKTLFGDLRKLVRGIIRELAVQKESSFLEGHLLPDHVHMLVSIPPKYSLA